MKVKLLITGGTIDKSYNMKNGELHFVDSHIPGMLAEARCRADIEIDNIMLKDSLNMDEHDRNSILERCQQYDESRVIVVHGTDTMAQTAQALAASISDKTIVLTGAMIPYVFKNSDSAFNLGCAMAAVQCLPEGVYVAMNGRIFSADNVTKNRDEGIFIELQEQA